MVRHVKDSAFWHLPVGTPLGGGAGAGGRFARSGRRRVLAGEYGDRGGNRAHQMNRAAAAFQPSTPATARRAQKERVAGQARQVRDQYARLAAGTLSSRERENISYQSPTKRAQSRARTGDVVMPRREALQRNTSLARNMAEHQAPRVGLTRTFTGKPKVARGYGPEAGVRLTSTAKAMIARRPDLRGDFPKKPRAARQVMAAKPSASQLALTSDAQLRAIAMSMGLTIPKRAGRNQLIKLITGSG